MNVSDRHAIRRAGRKGAPPLVLLHSLAANSDMWWPQVEGLGQDFEVITYDIRGHGNGPSPDAERPGMDGLVDDLCEVIEAVGGGAVAVLGLSLGGMIAQRHAATFPENVSRLVLADTDFYTPPDNPWAERIETLRRNGIDSIVESTLERWFTPGFIHSSPGACDRVREIIRETSLEGYVHCADLISKLDNRDCLAEIKAPTLVIVGEEDPSTPPARARALAEAIPGAAYASVEGTRHLPNIERSQAFNALVGEFLSPQ